MPFVAALIAIFTALLLVAACQSAAPPPPPPPPPPPATQTCPDGMVILATDGCPSPPPPPPPEPESSGPPLDGLPPTANGGGHGNGSTVSPGRPRDRMTGRPTPRSSLATENRDDDLTEVAEGPSGDEVAAVASQPEDGDILKGRGAFINPGDMNVGLWYPLRFVVGPDEAAIKDEAGSQLLATSETVFVGDIMQVTLLPNRNFDIEPKTSARTRTGIDKSASWSWNVSPKRDGSHSLEAKIEVLRLVNGKYEVVDEKTRNVAIKVKVGTWQGLMNALTNAASLGDVLTTLFNSWRGTFAALTALAVAAWGAWAAIRRGKKPASQG